MKSPLVWLITGTSSGFGHHLTLSALKRGDKVIATARPRSMSRLLQLEEKGADILELDVTSSMEDLNAIAKTAVGLHGKVDVLVNNAGYLTVGALEESTLAEAQSQFHTKVFGALNVTKAFLPYMRERKSGTTVFIGSLASWIPYPSCGLYAASNAAMKSISLTLNEEIAPLGLRSLCVEPGFFRTDVLSERNRSMQQARIADYQYLADKAQADVNVLHGKELGDPAKGVEVIVDTIRGEGTAEGKPFPKVLTLGSDAYWVTKAIGEATLARLEEWKEASCGTDFVEEA